MVCALGPARQERLFVKGDGTPKDSGGLLRRRRVTAGRKPNTSDGCSGPGHGVFVRWHCSNSSNNNNCAPLSRNIGGKPFDFDEETVDGGARCALLLTLGLDLSRFQTRMTTTTLAGWQVFHFKKTFFLSFDLG